MSVTVNEVLAVVKFLAEVCSAAALVGAFFYRLLRAQLMAEMNKKIREAVEQLSTEARDALDDVAKKSDLETLERHIGTRCKGIEDSVRSLTDHLIRRSP